MIVSDLTNYLCKNKNKHVSELDNSKTTSHKKKGYATINIINIFYGNLEEPNWS